MFGRIHYLRRGERSNQIDRIHGINYEDTITLYPNGTVVESTGGIIKWSSEGNNLTLTYLIEEEETDIIWRYVK